MKKVLVVLVALMCTTAFGVVGQVWNIRDDFDNSGGATSWGTPQNGPWEYRPGWDGTYDEACIDNFTGELPSESFGFRISGQQWMSLQKFETADGPTTTFGIGEVGGHGDVTVLWYAPEAGNFVFDLSGYNARSAGGNADLELSYNTFIGGGWGSKQVIGIIDKVNNVGIANAVSGQTGVISMNAGDFVVAEIVGGDWLGMGMTVTQVVPEPTTIVLLSLGSFVMFLGKR